MSVRRAKGAQAGKSSNMKLGVVDDPLDVGVDDRVLGVSNQKTVPLCVGVDDRVLGVSDQKTVPLCVGVDDRTSRRNCG